MENESSLAPFYKRACANGVCARVCACACVCACVCAVCVCVCERERDREKEREREIEIREREREREKGDKWGVARKLQLIATCKICN